MALAEVAGELSADGVFRNSKATYTYGTTIAHVAVDPATGQVEVLDFVTVDDVGRIINPLTLHGQVMGAAVQGLGSVFSEEIAYDENGQLLVGSLADYLIPVATDYPHLTRDLARAASLAEQSARRQGGGRGRHHPGRRCARECGRVRAHVARRRAARAAALAAAGVAAYCGGAPSRSSSPRRRGPITTDG